MESVNSQRVNGCPMPVASDEDVDAAVVAAEQAFTIPALRLLNERRSWSDWPDRIAAHRDELGMLDCVDGGNTLSGMRETTGPCSLRYFAGDHRNQG
jgi:acyl-CoA reductase-like NAD-dependent aldehyde dehydrogenase